MIHNAALAARLAGHLLAAEAVKLRPQEPFRWASGWRSPIYCDNRRTLAFPAIRNEIKEGFATLVRQHLPDADAVAGVATAGIAPGALLADALALPFVYVRSGQKGHGLENRIEGKVTPGQAVVVLEDLISTGGSALEAVAALRAAKFRVVGAVAIFTYGFAEASAAFQRARVPVWTLSDYETLLSVARTQDYLNDADFDTLRAWRQDPAGWGQPS